MVRVVVLRSSLRDAKARRTKTKMETKKDADESEAVHGDGTEM